MGSDALGTDRQVGQHDRLVGDVTLRDPVLEGALVRRIQYELSVIVGRRGLDDEARLHAGPFLGEGKTAKHTGCLNII